MMPRPGAFWPAVLVLTFAHAARAQECSCEEVYRATARLEPGHVIEEDDVQEIELPRHLVGDFNVRAPKVLVGERVVSAIQKGEWIRVEHLEPQPDPRLQVSLAIASRLVGRLRPGTRVDVVDLDAGCAVSDVELHRPVPGGAILLADLELRERLTRIRPSSLRIVARPAHVDPGAELEPCR